MKKRLLALLLASAMLCSMTPVAAFADDPAGSSSAQNQPVPMNASPEDMPAEPSAAPEMTAAPEPSETSEPTAAPEMTAAPSETPAPTAEPEATDGPAETAEPSAVPTETPAPTETPEPSAEPEPTATAEPAGAPEPTETPEPAAVALAEPQPVPEDLPAPVSDSPATVEVFYRETGGVNFITKPGLELSDYYMWVKLTDSGVNANDLTEYTFTLAGPGAEDSQTVTDIMAGDTDGNFAIWQHRIEKPGKYTVTISKDGDNVATGTVEIVAFTFNTGEGGYFDDDPKKTEHTSYYEGGSRSIRYLLRNGTVPKVTAKVSDKDLIGWAKEENKTKYEELLDPTGYYDVQSVIKQLTADENNTYTVYAAYGTKKTYGFQVLDGDAVVNAGSTIKLVDGKGVYDPVASKKELTLKSTGNQPTTFTANGTVDFLDVQYVNAEGASSGAGTTVAGENKGKLILTPKPGLKPGTYRGTVGMNIVTQGRTIYQFIVEFSVLSENLTVKLTAAKTKVYGETWTAANIPDGDITVVYENTEVPFKGTLSGLGVVLNSEGFKKDAGVGSYSYTLSTTSVNPAYTVKLDPSAPTLQVTPDTPQPQTLTAGGIHVGSPLSAAKLTGTFVNSHDATMGVTGTLAWQTADSAFNSSSAGEVEAKWIFTPDEAHSRNYTTATGTVKVTVSEKTATVLTPLPSNQKVVTYDGKPHALEYKSDRVGDATPVVVQYKLAGTEEWRETPPTAAGTYDVQVTVAESEAYARGTLTDTLTIEPKEIAGIDVNTRTRSYDGTKKAQNLITYIDVKGRVPGDGKVDVTIGNNDYSAKLESPNANGQAKILITVQSLSGSKAGNYRLPAQAEYHTYTSIFPTKLTVTQKLDAAHSTKKYGETLFLTADDFTITGLVEGDDAGIQFICEGAKADASVGGYSVSAQMTNTNYTFGSNGGVNPKLTLDNCGTVTVTQATPQLNGELSVGAGYKNGTLKNVSLAGGFVNSSNPDMPVPGTLAWVNGETTQFDNQTQYMNARWSFTPTDTNNYESLTNQGPVTVTLLDQQPVEITVEEASTAAVYTGSEQSLQVTLEPEGSTCLMEYRPFGSSEEEWTARQPVDAGTYEVRITAYPPAGEDAHAMNQITAQLTITPAKLKYDTLPQTLSVPEGTALASETVEKAFAGCFTFNGRPVEGMLSWLEPDGVISADDVQFVWVFVPASGNFTNASGNMQFTLAPDERTVKAAVYNLPAALGYQDYAVVDLAASGLRAGDEVTFFKAIDGNGIGTDPVSGSVPVTDEDIANQTLTVPLDSDALAPDTDGMLYARITSSQKNRACALPYHAEPGFALADNGGGPAESIMVSVGVGTYVGAKLANTHYTVNSVEFSLADAGIVAMQPGADAYTRRLTGLQQGSGAVLSAEVTFAHPDPARSSETITLTDTMAIACAGEFSAKASSGAGAPAVALDEETGDRLVTPDDRAALAGGSTVTYVLDVQDAAATAPAQDKAAIEAMAQSDGGYTVGCYLDIEITRYVNGAPAGANGGKIAETASPLTLTITIPTDLLAEARSAVGTPEFAVYRVHGAETVRLPDLDADPATVTIATDRFSTYALAYTKAKSAPDAETEQQEPGPDADAHGIPHTGDTAALRLWWCMLVLSGLGLAATAGLMRRRNRR